MTQTNRILYTPFYYENHFDLTLNRLITNENSAEYRVFTVDKRFVTNDLNLILSVCRRILSDKQTDIQLIISDSQIGQMIVAKLAEEYQRIRNRGMKFLNIFKCMNRYLLTEVFGRDECIPTLMVDMTNDAEENKKAIEIFFADMKFDIFVKSTYAFDEQSSSFRFQNWQTFDDMFDTYVKLYQEQYYDSLLPLFRIYIPKNRYSSIMKPNYLIQPFFDLITYPHWRLVIANACIYNHEIIMWPLVDGYCGWPFLTDRPLAILPILVCPSRQLSNEQENSVYNHFRKHLNHLINNYNLRFGWIECSYFVSCTNEIRLISLKPTCSAYLTNGFDAIAQYGNPIHALIDLSNHQRPRTPILNGKTVYIYRLWMKTKQKYFFNDLIDTKLVKRIKSQSNHCIRLRFHENDILNEYERLICIEIGFIQVSGNYHEIGLANLVELRLNLLKKPEIFPFVHHSLLSTHGDQFDPITCLPSNELLNQFEKA